MLVKCKSCGKEIDKGVKKCPNCGADQRNFFAKHKIITGILALIIIIAIGSAASGGNKSNPTSTPATSPSSNQTSSADSSSKSKQTPAPALTPKSLGAGTYTIRQHITSGRYTVTASSGSGNLVISDKSGMPVVNEILGSSGVGKVVASLPDGGKIEISGLNQVDFKPYQPPTIGASPAKTDLCAGSFIVNTDIPKGRYNVSVNGSGSGNLIIEDRDGMPKTNEILGGDMGVKNVAVDLDDSDIITISSLNDVSFVPSN